MRKLMVYILIVALCLSMCACGKSDAVKALEARIDELGEVTLEDQQNVNSIRYDFMILPAEEQAQVENLAVLEAAEAAIQAAVQKQRDEIDTIVADNAPAEAIALLRQMGDVSYARYQIRTLAQSELRAYLLQQGVPCDLMGDPKEDGEYRAVYIDGDEPYMFLIDTSDSEMLEFKQTDDSPVNRMVLSGYKLHKRTRNLYFMFGTSWYYAKTEHFSQGRDFFHVSWGASVPSGCSRENLSNIPVDMDCSNYQYWPYDMDEDVMEADIHSDVDDFVEEMDQCLEELGFFFTAYELMGIWE